MNTSDLHASSDESTSRTELRKIATAQRQVNVAVLFYLCFIPLNIWLASIAERAPIAAIGQLVVAIGLLAFCIVSVFRLASILRGNAIAVIHAFGMLVPLLGLLLLLRNNQKATGILQKNGIKVGLLGANPNSIPSD